MKAPHIIAKISQQFHDSRPKLADLSTPVHIIFQRSGLFLTTVPCHCMKHTSQHVPHSPLLSNSTWPSHVIAMCTALAADCDDTSPSVALANGGEVILNLLNAQHPEKPALRLLCHSHLQINTRKSVLPALMSSKQYASSISGLRHLCPSHSHNLYFSRSKALQCTCSKLPQRALICFPKELKAYAQEVHPKLKSPLPTAGTAGVKMMTTSADRAFHH